MNIEGMKKRKNHNVAPGGYNCPCCGPAPGKARDKARRRERARNKRDVAKEAKAAMMFMERGR